LGTATEQEECSSGCERSSIEIGEHIAVQNEELMVRKWMDKKPVSFISIFHCKSTVASLKAGRDLHKPKVYRNKIRLWEEQI
jgi:hypothetical protein